MSPPIITVENLGKRYQLGAGLLERALHRVAGCDRGDSDEATSCAECEIRKAP